MDQKQQQTPNTQTGGTHNMLHSVTADTVDYVSRLEHGVTDNTPGSGAATHAPPALWQPPRVNVEVPAHLPRPPAPLSAADGGLFGNGSGWGMAPAGRLGPYLRMLPSSRW